MISRIATKGGLLATTMLASTALDIFTATPTSLVHDCGGVDIACGYPG